MTKKYSILISYLIGTPIGLITIAFFFVLPTILSGEGLASMAIVEIYGKAIIGLIISFLVALGIAGINAFNNISKNNSLIIASIKYSLFVNLIIWTTFISITVIDNFDNFELLYIVPPIIGFLISVLITTFTIGLIICYLIKQKKEIKIFK